MLQHILIRPPVPSAFMEWMYVLESSNSLTLDSPFIFTIVTLSPLLRSILFIVLITLNMSFFFSVSGELVVCARAPGEMLFSAVVATSPSNDTDRNAKVSFSCFFLIPIVDKRSSFIYQQQFKYISAQNSSFIK